MFVDIERPIAKYNNIELHERKLIVDERFIKLTQKEESFLEYMMSNADKTQSRPDILKNVWKGAIVSERSIDTLVCKVRKKLPENYRELIKITHTTAYHGYLFGKGENERYTMSEQKIMDVLKNNPDIAVPISDILKATHQTDDCCSRASLRVMIYKLRKKLKENTKDTIITKKNMGYQWKKSA